MNFSRQVLVRDSALHNKEEAFAEKSRAIFHMGFCFGVRHW